MSLRGFASLLSFLTIIPARRHDIEEASKSFYLVPLIGLITGVITVLPLIFIDKPMLSAIIATSITYIVTGFIHLDGLADFMDALASGKRGTNAIKVMKEPWRGTYAVVAVSLCILLTYVSILELRSLPLAILISYVMIYESMFILAIMSPKPNHKGLGRVFIDNAKRPHSLLKNIVTLMCSLMGVIIAFHALMLGIDIELPIRLTLLSLTTSISTSLITLKLAKRVIGYVSGDVLGFNLEICRSLTLLILALLIT